MGAHKCRFVVVGFSGVRPMPVKILLTGATGYVGGRLLSVLEERGDEVRCLARHPANVVSRVRHRTRVVAGDVLDPASPDAALQGIDVAYYLVHSMGEASGFEHSEPWWTPKSSH
jgi:uncharacterized protein YbjT (DUF2867 family)